MLSLHFISSVQNYSMFQLNRFEIFFIEDRQFIIRMSCGPVLSIIYTHYMFVAVDIQQAIRLHHIVIYGLPGSNYFYVLSHKRQISKKKKYY
jgi:hypothetical protein